MKHIAPTIALTALCAPAALSGCGSAPQTREPELPEAALEGRRRAQEKWDAAYLKSVEGKSGQQKVDASANYRYLNPRPALPGERRPPGSGDSRQSW